MIIFFIIYANYLLAYTNIDQSQLSICKSNEDCIIVPYSHCCGSTKRAINKTHKALYNATKDWQKFNNPQQCAVMGACLPDKNKNSTVCIGGEIKHCHLQD